MWIVTIFKHDKQITRDMGNSVRLEFFMQK